MKPKSEIYYITENSDYEGYGIVFMHTEYDKVLHKFQELKKKRNFCGDSMSLVAWNTEKQEESEIDIVHRKPLGKKNRK